MASRIAAAGVGFETGGSRMADTGSSLTVGDAQMNAIQKGCGSGVVACPKVTVAIELPQPVACPGHPLPIRATGSPAGGTYAWSVSGAARRNRPRRKSGRSGRGLRVPNYTGMRKAP